MGKLGKKFDKVIDKMEEQQVSEDMECDMYAEISPKRQEEYMCIPLKSYKKLNDVITTCKDALEFIGCRTDHGDSGEPCLICKRVDKALLDIKDLDRKEDNE